MNREPATGDKQDIALQDNFLLIGRRFGKGEMSFGRFLLDSRNPWPRARTCLPKDHALIAIYREVPSPNVIAGMVAGMVHAPHGSDHPGKDSFIILQQRASPPHPEFRIDGPPGGDPGKAPRIRLQGPAEWSVGSQSGVDELSFRVMLLDRNNPWPEARNNITEGFVLQGIYRQVPPGTEWKGRVQ